MMLVFMLAAVAAQAPADPGPVVVPDLAVPADKLGDERKFFVFHKAGVSYAEAADDLGFCARYIPHGMNRRTPSFVPWVREDAVRKIEYNNNYGLVGAAMLAVIAGPLERSNRQTKMIRCMAPRGYARFRTSEALWKQINGEDMQQSIAVQAKIASGPVPPTARTLP